MAADRRLAAAGERAGADGAVRISGGAIGPDGWLYLLGHDRPELYVVGRPTMGPVLVHVATIAIESEGQAFSWAKNGARVIYTIDRRKHLVRTIAIPPIVVKEAAVRRFR